MADLIRTALGVAALVVAVALAAGCGGGSQPATTTRAANGGSQCKLSAKQRRVQRRAKAMIPQMHRLELPLKTVHEHGPMKLELLLNRFLLTIGTLPVYQRENLIRHAKAATGLCRDCFDALEAMEPATQTRFGQSACKAGF